MGQLAIIVPLYAWALASGLGEGEAHSLVFVNLLLGNISMIFSNRYWTKNIFSIVDTEQNAFWYITGMAIALLLVTLHIPSVSALFHFSPLHPWQYLLCLGTGILAVAINEIAKLPSNKIPYRLTVDARRTSPFDCLNRWQRGQKGKFSDNRWNLAPTPPAPVEFSLLLPEHCNRLP